MNPKSSKPRKQRKFSYNLALHQLYKRMAVHLSRELRKQLGKRNVPVKKGDTVQVLSGKNTGKSGKITAVDYHTSRVAIEKVLRKKSDGKEIPVWIATSNLVITELETKDVRRLGAGKKTGSGEKKAIKETKTESAQMHAAEEPKAKTESRKSIAHAKKEPKTIKQKVKSK
ncbi:MAG: 50S ribosomal protein L24 [Candidatus Diapherotrites archaeon]|nr:50S ribosomal protein L24 [Candidatus Diapherotrites archaeon]